MYPQKQSQKPTFTFGRCLILLVVFVVVLIVLSVKGSGASDNAPQKSKFGQSGGSKSRHSFLVLRAAEQEGNSKGSGQVASTPEPTKALPVPPVKPTHIQVHLVGATDIYMAIAYPNDMDTFKDEIKFYAKQSVKSVHKLNGKPIHQVEDLDEHVWVLLGEELWVWPTYNSSFVVPMEAGAYTVKVISVSPRVLLLEHFLSDEECDSIIQTATPLMQRSQVSKMGATGGTGEVSDVRNSDTAWIWNETPSINKVRRRVQELMQVPMGLSEKMQILHYGPKQHYYAHHDYFDPLYYPGEVFKSGHNRFATVFFYLTTVEEGGETIFPYSGDDTPVTDFKRCDRGLKVKPVKGNAIVFYDMLAAGHRTGALDPKSLHGACDVIKGNKWSANYWLRNRAGDGYTERFE